VIKAAGGTIVLAEGRRDPTGMHQHPGVAGKRRRVRIVTRPARSGSTETDEERNGRSQVPGDSQGGALLVKT
jgi:hypothetical protein